jgi:hypothetical protein
VKNELDIVRDISQRFASAGIPFMLTGSMAMNYYAIPRMTRDIDVVVVLHQDDVATLVRTFSPDYYLPETVGDAVLSQTMFNLIHTESVIKVDCIIRKNTPYRRLEFERRRLVSIQDFETFIVSKEDLILSKLAWARDSHSEMQLRDVRNLLDTGCDMPYLEQWAKALEVGSLLKEARGE